MAYLCQMYLFTMLLDLEINRNVLDLQFRKDFTSIYKNRTLQMNKIEGLLLLKFIK